MMDIKLNVELLKAIGEVVAQKCLLPETSFPVDIQPGAWVKCILNSGHYIVCQLYPRIFADNRQDHCFVDLTVSTSPIPEEDDRCRLVGIEKLIQAKPIRLELEYVLIPRFFSTSATIDLEYLKNIFLQYCSTYKLVDNGVVRTQELLKIGVSSIHVKAEIRSMNDEVIGEGNYYFTLSEGIPIAISNAKMQSPFVEKAYYLGTHNEALATLCNKTNSAFNHKLDNWRRQVAVNVLITGTEGSGKSSVVSEFVKYRNINCFVLCAPQVFMEYTGQAEDKITSIFQNAITFASKLKPKSPTIIFIKNLHIFCPKLIGDQEIGGRIGAHVLDSIDNLREYTEKLGIYCIATTAKPMELDDRLLSVGRFTIEMKMPELNINERKVLFRGFFNQSYICKDLHYELTPELLRQGAINTEGYTVADIGWLVQQIGYNLLIVNNGKLRDAFERAFKIPRVPSCDAFILVRKLEEGFETIAGLQKLKESLKICVLGTTKNSRVFQRFGLRMPKGILFYGPPGCCKTMLAKVLAKEAGMAFISVTGADIYSPYLGSTEKYLTKLFNDARKCAPCVLFLDEIDAMVGSRSLINNDVQMRVLSTLLMEMDGILSNATYESTKQVLIIGATNRPDMIDEALLRPGRFDKLFHVPAPDTTERLAILNMMAKKVPFAPGFNVHQFIDRTVNYSGADMVCLCNEVAIRSLGRKYPLKEITQNDFDCVMEDQHASLIPAQIKWYHDMEDKGSFSVPYEYKNIFGRYHV